METGSEDFSGKIGPRGCRHSERDRRSRSLCRRAKGPISTKARRCQSLFVLVYGSKVRKRYYYYKFKMQNKQNVKNSTYIHTKIKRPIEFTACYSSFVA